MTGPMSKLIYNQCDHFWPNFATLSKFSQSLAIYFNGYLVIGKISKLLLSIFCYWDNFIIVNGQILNKQSNHLATV